MRFFLALFLVLILASCQTATATPIQNVTDKTPTLTPNTIEKQLATPTLILEPTAVPTVTLPPNLPAEQAGTLCEKTTSSSSQSGKLEMPYLGMLKVEWDEQPAWHVSNSIPHLFATSEESLETIICFSESRRQIGTYTDMSAGYQVTLRVDVLSWPNGTVLASKIFMGGNPPQTKTGFGDVYGLRPTGVIDWIISQINGAEHPDFLFLQKDGNGSTIAISPDGKTLALGISDASNNSSKIELLNIQNLQPLFDWVAHAGKINDLIFSPDGHTIVSAGSDSKIFFWNAVNGNEIGNVSVSSPYTIQYSPDGKYIATSSTTSMHLIDPLSMQILTSYPTSSITFSFSPDGNAIYTDTGSMETLTGNNIHQFYDYSQLIPTISAEGEVSFDTGLPDFITKFTLAPDGTYGISYSFASSTEPLNAGVVYALSKIDINAWKQVSMTQFKSTSFDMLGFSPNGDLFAVGIGPEIWLLDTNTWQAAQILKGHTGRVIDAAFSLDGKKLISLSVDRTIRVWRLEN